MPRLSGRLTWRPYRKPHPSVVAWARAMPPGVAASTGVLLTSFLASKPRRRVTSTWSSLTLGSELARLMRLDLRRRQLHGADVWSFEPGPRGVGLPWA